MTWRAESQVTELMPAVTEANCDYAERVSKAQLKELV